MRRLLAAGVALVLVAALLALAPEASASHDFPDVPTAHPFHDEISWMAESGITTGFPDGNFRPAAPVTRQSMAAFMQRLYDLLGGQAVTPTDPGFPDVPASHPFYDEIAWMAESGITTGFPDGTFRPGDAVTRQSMAAFMQRLSDLLDGPVWSGADPGFPDVAASHPFFDQIAWMAETGVTTGFPDGTFRPGDAVTRQSMAAFMQRLYDLLDDEEPTIEAPPVDETVATDLIDAGEFLYTGPDAVQLETDPGAFDPERAALVRGRVLDSAGAPVAGVRVEVLDHPEFGFTETRADGVYDLAINGGGTLVLDYSKTGLLPSQRDLVIGWQQWATVDDVVLVGLDPAVTTVDMGSSDPFQVVAGSAESDADGSRRGVLLVPAGTGAMLVDEGGIETPADALDVRITEYTVGPRGDEAMPGDLPASSAYTYAFELSADEAIAADAVSVVFDQPLPYYVENFLDFPVGTDVPVGYYDRLAGDWVPAEDGRVIEIVSETGGAADLDVDGDGAADSGALLTALGITEAERTELAARYAPGGELWRIHVEHFTPIDENWPKGAPDGAVAPAVATAKPPQPPPAPTLQPGKGTVMVEDQSLSEALPVPGTPLSLSYDSHRTGVGAVLEIPISGAAALPASLKRIELTVNVAGRRFTSTHSSAPGQVIDFTWDGKDAFGRLLHGSQAVGIEIAYVYNGVYQTPAAVQQSFGVVSGVPIVADPARREVSLSLGYVTSLEVWDARGGALGGWSLPMKHSYDPVGRVLHLGSGGSRRVQDLNAEPIETVAGKGGCNPALPPGSLAVESDICQPSAMATGPDGSIYFAQVNLDPRTVRRIRPDGVLEIVAGGPPPAQPITARELDVGPDGILYILDSYRRVYKVVDGVLVLVAGNGAAGFSGDGGPATAAAMSIVDLAIGPDGSVYVANSSHSRVRRVDPDGIIETVAGTGVGPTVPFVAGNIRPPIGDGGPAIEADVWPTALEVDVNGVLYISQQAQIRRVGVDGIIETIAGNGTILGHNGDGGSALAAGIDAVDLAVGDDAALYFSGTGIVDSRVRRIDPDGTISTVVGRDGVAAGFTPDGQPAVGADVNGLDYIALDPDGTLYFSDRINSRIRSAGDPYPGFSGDDILVPDVSGDVIFRFDEDGRHLSTESALTGAALVTFGYDADGRATTVDLADGGVTTIAYPPAGGATFTGPDGDSSTITVDTNGWLDVIDGFADWAVDVDHDPQGRMTALTTPDDATFAFTWSGSRVATATDATSGVTTYTRVSIPGGHQVTAGSPRGTTFTELVTLGDRSRRQVVTAPDGTETTTVLRPDGSQIATAPSGQTVESAIGPDPRFGMLAPVGTYGRVATPGGATVELTRTRDVTLADPEDLTSITSMTQTVSIAGRTTTRTYDVATRELVETTPEGRATSTVFDADGRVLSAELPGHLGGFSYSYDGRGRATKMTQEGSPDRVWTMAYDGDDNLASITDPLGRSTSFGYDSRRRLTSQTMPGGRTITSTYLPDGQLATFSPPGKPAHEYEWTEAGQIAAYRPPPIAGDDGDVESTYLAGRQPDTVTLSDGAAIDYTYDAFSRLVTATQPGRTVTLAYDPATGDLASSATGSQTVAYDYDGTLLTDQTWSGVTNGMVTRGYDPTRAPLLASWTVAGAVIPFVRDDDGMLTAAGDLTLDRNPASGEVDGLGLGVVDETRATNEFGEPIATDVTVSGVPVYATDLVRDGLGRITTETTVVGPQTTTKTYSYDPAGRISGVSSVVNGGAPVAVSYTYDANGNRLTGPGISGTATYDTRDRITADAARTWDYGPNGAVESRTAGSDVTTYDSDVRGVLRGVTLPDGTDVTYTYDGDGRRVARAVDGTITTRWLYYDGRRPAAELDGAGAVRSRFVYSTRSWVPDYLIKDGVTYRVVSDTRGSVRLVINAATGAVAQRIDYDVYGRITLDTSPGFQPFGFAGGVLDPATGLTHLGFRDYDADTGRFLTPDGMGFDGQSSNQYSYVNGDPVNLIDPTGLTNTRPDDIRELLWALAYEEERIGGWAKMRDAYGAVDCAEHAHFGDGEAHAPAITGDFGLGGTTAWMYVQAGGGRFLPKRNHEIKLDDGSIVDMRWFVQGYLSSFSTIDLRTNAVTKAAVGWMYNWGKGYYADAPENAEINDRSVALGSGWAANGHTLADFARFVSGGPPPSGSYRDGSFTSPFDG